MNNRDRRSAKRISYLCEVEWEGNGMSRVNTRVNDLSITGAFIALVDCIRSFQKDLPDPKKFPLTGNVAAISVGIVDGKPALDLDYKQDVDADVDMNVVMTGSGRFIEIQGTGEEATFGDDDLAALLKLAKHGIRELTAIQKKALGKAWPFS